MLQHLHIRPADVDDAALLAPLAEQTFRDAFADDNTDDDMEAYVGNAFSLRRIRSELAEDTNTFLLAFFRGTDQPTGYAKLRRGTTDPSVTGPAPVELERLYVGQRVIGRGVGAALMQASLETAASEGYQTVWLGVWERNERAIGFYKRWGFEVTGSHVFCLGSDEQTDLIMERPVPGSKR